jgi:hypothetical protein
VAKKPSAGLAATAEVEKIKNLGSGFFALPMVSFFFSHPYQQLKTLTHLKFGKVIFLFYFYQ